MTISNRVQNANCPQRSRPSTQGGFTTYFHTECAVCGCPLRVLVEYLGHEVVCQRCGGPFIAYDPDSSQQTAPTALEKANRLLDR